MSEEIKDDVMELELTEEQLDALLDGLDGNELSPEERIDEALFEDRIIYLSGVVCDSMSAGLIPLIHFYNLEDEKNGIEESSRKPIKLYIDSEGGDLYKGFNMVSTIINSKTPIHTYLEGSIGMSAGLLLYLAGKKKHMSKFGNLMYHELRFSHDYQTLVEAENMQKHYRELQKHIDEFIAERSSLTAKQLKEKRKKNIDWFITYSEAKKYKLFDVEL